MADVVLVHGIAQEHRSAGELEDEWLPALELGLRTAGQFEVADQVWLGGEQGSCESRMAFYGDLFLVPGQQGEGPAALDQETGVIATQLAAEWLQRAATRSTWQDDMMFAASLMREELGEGGVQQGSGEISRKAIGGLCHLRWFAPFGMAFAERFVWTALSQVTSYLANDQVRSEVLDRVASLISEDTRVVIGHSLGSVVAYEAAHRLARPLPLLVTIGSPLGLRTVVYERLRPQPPSYPKMVRRWVNIADRDDLVAAEPDLTELFGEGVPPESILEGGYTVDNGAKPHSALFYLSKREIGRPVGDALRLIPA